MYHPIPVANSSGSSEKKVCPVENLSQYYHKHSCYDEFFRFYDQKTNTCITNRFVVSKGKDGKYTVINHSETVLYDNFTEITQSKLQSMPHGYKLTTVVDNCNVPCNVFDISRCKITDTFTRY
jgi:hypothetical protein